MKILIKLIIYLCPLFALAGEFEYINFKLAYEPYQDQEVVHSGVIIRLLSGTPNPTNRTDVIAYEVLNAVFEKDISKAHKLSCASYSECESFIQQWQQFAPEFFETKWRITRKEKIDSVVYFWLEDNYGHGISWRFKQDSTGVLKWNPGGISNYLHFRIINSIRPEGDEMSALSKYTIEGMEGFPFSDHKSDEDLFLYANIAVATSTNGVTKLKRIEEYNQIFNHAVGDDDHIDFKLGLLPTIEGKKWFFAVLDADPLYIFWIPHVKEEKDGMKNSGLWVYEILKEKGEYKLQDKQSLARELSMKMINAKILNSKNHSL